MDIDIGNMRVHKLLQLGMVRIWKAGYFPWSKTIRTYVAFTNNLEKVMENLW